VILRVFSEETPAWLTIDHQKGISFRGSVDYYSTDWKRTGLILAENTEEALVDIIRED